MKRGGPQNGFFFWRDADQFSERLDRVAVLAKQLHHASRLPYQTIAADDIGGFAALSFERPKDFIGLELEIAGSELTNPQAAEVFSRVLGRPVEFVEMAIPAEKEYFQMFHWFNNAGFQANIGVLRQRYPELKLQTLEQWLFSEGWHKHARHVVAPKV